MSHLARHYLWMILLPPPDHPLISGAMIASLIVRILLLPACPSPPAIHKPATDPRGPRLSRKARVFALMGWPLDRRAFRPRGLFVVIADWIAGPHWRQNPRCRLASDDLDRRQCSMIERRDCAVVVAVRGHTRRHIVERTAKDAGLLNQLDMLEFGKLLWSFSSHEGEHTQNRKQVQTD